MSEWNPVSTTPKDGTWGLGFWISEGVPVDGENYCVVKFVGGFWQGEDGERYVKQPAFWMPLPEPPEVSRG